MKNRNYVEAGIPVYANLCDYRQSEPGFSVYCAILKCRWANYLIRDLKLQVANEHHIVPHGVEISYDADQDLSIVDYYANRLVPWFISTETADILTNLRSVLDYCWMGLVRADQPLSRSKPKFPSRATQAEVRFAIQNEIKGPLVERTIDVFDVVVQPWRVDEGGSEFFSALNTASNWIKHNRLPLFETTFLLHPVVISRGHMPSVRFQRQAIAPGGRFREVFKHRVTKVRGAAHNRTSFGEPAILPHLEYIPAMETLSDYAEGVIRQFILRFPETAWFAHETDRMFGQGYNLKEGEQARI